MLSSDELKSLLRSVGVLCPLISVYLGGHDDVVGQVKARDKDGAAAVMAGTGWVVLSTSTL